jgi:tryptophanyl-tRNA synthetase
MVRLSTAAAPPPVPEQHMHSAMTNAVETFLSSCAVAFVLSAALAQPEQPLVPLAGQGARASTSTQRSRALQAPVMTRRSCIAWAAAPTTSDSPSIETKPPRRCGERLLRPRRGTVDRMPQHLMYQRLLHSIAQRTAVCRKRILSGVQPTGNLHLGNYCGAVKNWVPLQEDYGAYQCGSTCRALHSDVLARTVGRAACLQCASHVSRTGTSHALGPLAVHNVAPDSAQHLRRRADTFFCVVDLHAITMPHEPKGLRAASRATAAAYIAAGVDTAKSAIFMQSHVAGHSELAWLLGCYTPIGWLERMIQFKARAAPRRAATARGVAIVWSTSTQRQGCDKCRALYLFDASSCVLRAYVAHALQEKSSKQGESVGSGLLTYPTLMAADILLYQADLVPVGEDQKQHIELARNICERVNGLFGGRKWKKLDRRGRGGSLFRVPKLFMPPAGARVMSLTVRSWRACVQFGDVTAMYCALRGVGHDAGAFD